MDSDRNKLHPVTRLNHSPEVPLPEGNYPILSPIYQTAKFRLSEDVPLSSQFAYTRVSNPTLRQLELSLAELQKTEDCIVVGSGMAAITGAILGLMKTGDHLITFMETYRPARIFTRTTLKRFGMTATVLGLSELAKLEAAITPQTKIIYFESPTNPHLNIADIKKIVSIAKKHNVLVMMDATFGGPHQHTDLGVDVFLQSLTKYANGHGDVIAGSIAGKKAVIHEIRQMTINLGATLDPHAAYLVQRGLKTYHLRYERQAATAKTLAEFLEKFPKVKRVLYPGLPSHPGHELARSQMSSMGGILAFEVDPSLGTALEICHRVKLIQFTASVGSAETLICPTAMFFGDDLSPEELNQLGMNPYTLRISVGLEHSEDLIADLRSALE
ncbi:MAG: aminotransferase class I/II-fold pyridoxal phosphate-dependent enzyme [Bdellovibrionota bacterium]